VRYVALLRGINVGGKNLIRMSALKACFEEHGFDGVSTYIQSGNVLFGSSETRVPELTLRVERMLSGTFDHYPASVVVRSLRQMRQIVDRAPAGFGADPSAYRYDVIFLKAPLTAKTAIKDVTARDGVDEATAGTGVLYFSRLERRASQSYLSRIISLPIYQQMTIRNWNTTKRLLGLLESTPG
jgi:uncharacterized protein (DUF1697 family)